MKLTSEDIQTIQEVIVKPLSIQMSSIESRLDKVENRLEKIEVDVASMKKDVGALAIINQLDEIKKDSRLSRVLQLQA